MIASFGIGGRRLGRLLALTETALAFGVGGLAAAFARESSSFPSRAPTRCAFPLDAALPIVITVEIDAELVVSEAPPERSERGFSHSKVCGPDRTNAVISGAGYPPCVRHGVHPESAKPVTRPVCCRATRRRQFNAAGSPSAPRWLRPAEKTVFGGAANAPCGGSVPRARRHSRPQRARDRAYSRAATAPVPQRAESQRVTR